MDHNHVEANLLAKSDLLREQPESRLVIGNLPAQFDDKSPSLEPLNVGEGLAKKIQSFHTHGSIPSNSEE